MNASEWVYEIVFPLPLGWKIVRLKKKYRKFLRDQYKSPILWRRTEIKTGSFKEEYWPCTYLKHYGGRSLETKRNR